MLSRSDSVSYSFRYERENDQLDRIVVYNKVGSALPQSDVIPMRLEIECSICKPVAIAEHVKFELENRKLDRDRDNFAFVINCALS